MTKAEKRMIKTIETHLDVMNEFNEYYCQDLVVDNIEVSVKFQDDDATRIMEFNPRG